MSEPTRDNGLAAVTAAFNEVHQAADDADLAAEREAMQKLREAYAHMVNSRAKSLTAHGVALALLVRAESTHVTGAINRIGERLKALEAGMADVRERGVRYMGVHQRAQSYERGDIVTAKSGLWIALKATDQAPGNGTDWQLSVKGG